MNKLLIFGDSIFKGVTFSDEKNRYIICPHTFEKKLAESGIATENCCKMGATIDKIEQIVDRKTELMDKDTIVLLEFGGNDCDFDWQKVSDNPFAPQIPQTPCEEFISSYKKIFKKIKDTGAEIVMSNLVPIDSEKFMNWISRGKSYDSIMTFLGDITMIYRWQESYNTAVEYLAKEMDCPLVDVRSNFITSHKYKDLICSDGLHPTQLGHEIIDSTLYNYFSQYKSSLHLEKIVC